jgi:hypothetical protein
MLKYLSSFIWDEPKEIKPSDRQTELRHLLLRQITLNNMVLKSTDVKPSVSDALIEYELKKISKIPIKQKKKKVNKRKYFSNLK